MNLDSRDFSSDKKLKVERGTKNGEVVYRASVVDTLKCKICNMDMPKLESELCNSWRTAVTDLFNKVCKDRQHHFSSKRDFVCYGDGCARIECDPTNTKSHDEISTEVNSKIARMELNIEARLMQMKGLEIGHFLKGVYATLSLQCHDLHSLAKQS